MLKESFNILPVLKIVGIIHALFDFGEISLLDKFG